MADESTTTTTTPAGGQPAAAPAPPPPAAPAVPPAAPPPAAPPPAAAPAPQAVPQPGEPAWLPPRLEQARKSALRDAGFESPEQAKADMAELKKRRESEQSELEKAQGKAAELETAAADRDRYLEVIRTNAIAKLATLNEPQQAAVKAIAGEDPARQLSAMDSLAPTWAATPPAPAAGAPAGQPPVPAPADTSQPSGSPPQATPQQEEHLAKFEALQKQHPAAAQRYYLKHPLTINEARKARAS